jgi:hypothetical protein
MWVLGNLRVTTGIAPAAGQVGATDWCDSGERSLEQRHPGQQVADGFHGRGGMDVRYTPQGKTMETRGRAKRLESGGA